MGNYNYNCQFCSEGKAEYVDGDIAFSCRKKRAFGDDWCRGHNDGVSGENAHLKYFANSSGASISSLKKEISAHESQHAMIAEALGELEVNHDR